ncbi:MAG: hypothetical protein H3C34_03090 [Caldilineaceae bacterium]|nr:hypothetical protein [Caldilineaceae bacterium]
MERRQVACDLIEATPDANGLGYWLLASPLLLFMLWAWVDLFAYYSPIPLYWLDAAVAAVVFAFLVVLPVGWLAHRIVTALPRLLQHAGWDVAPLEPVRETEIYTVRYVYNDRRRAPGSWQRQWLRAAQGWVYIEIAAILVGGVLMVPIFFSALDFGFGQ